MYVIISHLNVTAMALFVSNLEMITKLRPIYINRQELTS